MVLVSKHGILATSQPFLCTLPSMDPSRDPVQDRLSKMIGQDKKEKKEKRNRKVCSAPNTTVPWTVDDQKLNLYASPSLTWLGGQQKK